MQETLSEQSLAQSRIETSKSMHYDINIMDGRWIDYQQQVEHSIEQGSLRLLNHLNINIHYEISVTLCDDDYIQSLNNQHRHKDKPTNVLSFPTMLSQAQNANSMHQPIPLGDVILSFDTIQRQAAESHKSFEDHVNHLLIHSLLHLLGFDHQTIDSAHEMETLEIDILNQMNIKNPYLIHPLKIKGDLL